MTSIGSRLDTDRHRLRLAGWSLAIAATGTPATVAVLLCGRGGGAATGAGIIGTITLAALAAARAFGVGSEDIAETNLHRRRRRHRAAGDTHSSR